MTKDQAARIIQSKCFGITSTGQADNWAEVFEDLGFIKFDPPVNTTHIPVWNGRAYISILKENVICALDMAGYEVKKK